MQAQPTDDAVAADRHPRSAPAGDGFEPAAAPLDFIPVELGRIVIPSQPTVAEEPAPQPIMLPPVADADETWTERTSLFGELEL